MKAHYLGTWAYFRDFLYEFNEDTYVCIFHHKKKTFWLLNHYQPNIYEDHSERIIQKSHFELDIHQTYAKYFFSSYSLNVYEIDIWATSSMGRNKGE